MGDPAEQAAERAALYLQHPDESPKLIGVLPYLIHPPSRLSSTASWIAFRDRTLLPMMRSDPDDPNLPNFLAQVEKILAWRATVRPQDRFWRPDPRAIPTADGAVRLAERVLAHRYPLADAALAAGSLVGAGRPRLRTSTWSCCSPRCRTPIGNRLSSKESPSTPSSTTRRPCARLPTSPALGAPVLRCLPLHAFYAKRRRSRTMTSRRPRRGP